MSDYIITIVCDEETYNNFLAELSRHGIPPKGRGSMVKRINSVIFQQEIIRILKSKKKQKLISELKEDNT